MESNTTMAVILYVAGLLSGGGLVAIIGSMAYYLNSKDKLDFHLLDKAANTAIDKAAAK